MDSIKLRDMAAPDIPIIENWPAYPEEFKDLDYALREGGWISQYSCKVGTETYTAEENGVIIGFTILSRDDPDCRRAEFRIALSPSALGQGLGKKLVGMTLEKGFMKIDLEEIYLIVRRKNHRAISLYEKSGFRCLGEMRKEINGAMVDLYEMAIEKRHFWKSKGE
ncbi:Mycothiol acetyltransferase [uncultured archaeon]|nr:Mycothiol acetyltransferase [uncultured archaeon]